MIVNNMTFRIGGEAGQGVESSGAGFAKALSRGGLYVFGLQDYMSRIRGGHNYFQVRAGAEQLYSHEDAVHVLMAMVPEAIERHGHEVVDGGGVIYDQGFEVDREKLQERGIKFFSAPLLKMAKESGSEIMANTAALAVAAGVTGYPLQYMEGVIRDNFKKKGTQIVDANLEVAQKAYAYGSAHYAESFEFKLEPRQAPQRMVINGNHAIALGALLGGCRFMSAYPMTPATSILEWLSTHAWDYGLMTKHTEDELAAILMAIGASFAGVRAMTATSGGGFSLMTEALGMAGMTETPLVIVEAERPGPSTGMPTRTGQGDLLFMLRASQGEFPRIVLTPGTVEQCFESGWRAFNLAEKYQCPVIILIDNFLSNSLRAIERSQFGFEDVKVERGQFLTREDLDGLTERYKRYAFTESGVSPRAAPGHPNAVFVACSDEHDELGHFADEDAENRVRMMRKRMRKLDLAADEIRAPSLYGPQQAEVTLLAWGSTYGPAREAVDRINQDGGSANLLHVVDVWPVAEDKVRPMLESAKRLVDVESNATGQFARLIRAYTGVEVDAKILRFDGRPFSPQYILDRLE
jgi:2-oxoglutarate ferredoxin oxidoreductase subunit alpha